MPARDVALAQFGKVEPGGKMIAFGGEQHRTYVGGNSAEESVQADHGVVVERVAFLNTVEPKNRDLAPAFGRERDGQRDGGKVMRLGHKRPSE